MEQLLEYLCRYGNPTLWRMRDGEWACMLSVFVTGPGCNFEVKHMNGKTPEDALLGCKNNLDAALVLLKANMPTLASE